MKRHRPGNHVFSPVLFWLGVVLFWSIVPVLNPNTHLQDLPFHIGNILIPSLLTWLFHAYTLAYILVPLVLDRQFGRFFLGTLVLSGTSWFLYDALDYVYEYSLAQWFPEHLTDVPRTWLFWSSFPGARFYESNLTAGAFAGLTLFSGWQQKQTEARRLEREKMGQELSLLKIQLNPDLLFGALTTLHGQIEQQSEQAPALVLDLAHFLRYVLYENKADTVPLALEMDIIRHYVALQRVMHPTDLEVSLTLRGDLTDRVIPPYVLFPIVEQAFGRLGLEQPTQLADEPAWISIDLAVGETSLTLKVINGQPVSNPNDAAWLSDRQKQLSFHYARAYDLQLYSKPDAHITVLTLPFSVVPVLFMA